MRDEYQGFTDRGAQILAIGPNRPHEFVRYWQNERIPYSGLPDPDHRVAQLYRQQVNLFKLGRMPLVSVVDKDGRIRYVHYGASMSDIPSNALLFRVIDELNASSVST
jgi:peroxiredoxin Q/BCP